MICQKCHKNLATIRYAEVIDGKVADLMICPGCYELMQKGAGAGFEIAGEAPTPRRLSTSPRPNAVAVPKRLCKSCGRDLRDILKTGLAGCTMCYDVFEEALNPLMRGAQVALRHRGKTPRHDSPQEGVRISLQKKRALLRSVLKLENYEEAAVLRDEIRQLEEQLGAASPSNS